MFNSTPLRTYCQDFSFGHNETVEKLFFRLFPFAGKTSLSRKQNYSPEELCRVLPLAQVVHFEVESTKDILKYENGMVTFRYLHSKTGQYQTRTVAGEYFLYLLMLHVLPKGFRRTRDYGFLHSCSKKLIRFLQLILHVSPFKISYQKKERPKIICPICGAIMRIIKTRIKQPDTGEAICYTTI